MEEECKKREIRRGEMKKVGERIKLEDICVQRKLVVGHVDGDHSNTVLRAYHIVQCPSSINSTYV